MTTATFARHFLICGLDSSVGLELDEVYSGGSSRGLSRQQSDAALSEEFFNPLERSYKPKVLRIYPEPADWSNFNSDALGRLILPQGLRFCTEREIDQCVNKAHPFVMTKEDGEKSYGVALIFYERVEDSNICHAVHTLERMYSTESEVSGANRQQRTTERSLRPRSAGTAKSSSERSRSLPRHYQQVRMTAAASSSIFSSNVDLSTATYDYRKNSLFVTKAVALICSEAMVSAATQALECMLSYVKKSSQYDVQVLEGLIFNLLHDIPIPNPGRSVRFWCLGEAMTISMPKIPHELPLFDYNLLDFFDILGVDNALKLFVCILLEYQVLVYSSAFDNLMLVCESITALLYPFAWQHVYVPILPPYLENFLDAPVPYVMGLLRRSHDLELSKRGSVCIVDIDNGQLDLPEELPSFPYETEFAEEIRSTILKFGGKDGVDLLKEHAVEAREIILQEAASSSASSNNLNHSASAPKLDNESSTMDQLNQMISRFEMMSANCTPTRNKHEDRMKLNTALREVFVNRFAHMFQSFEHFVIIQNESDLSLTPQQAQETAQNFDKTSFLSDQKLSHLSFLSRFIETQMFCTFIDECIQRMTADAEADTPFDVRLASLRERYGDALVRTPTYEACDRIDITIEILSKRLKHVEFTVKPQKVQQSANGNPQTGSPGVFPLMEAARFECSRKSEDSAIFIKGYRQSMSLDPSLVTPAAKITMLNSSPAAIAETNWKFVVQLLKECKAKTKRILLETLGQEAVQWGHGGADEGFSGSEENMLVASLCDLIERIWSHGLQKRSGKSSLWHFLYKFGRANERSMRFKGSLGKQAFCSPMIQSKPFVLPDHSRSVQVVIDPKKSSSTFQSSVMALVHNVATLQDVKTEIGYARAWVRLALERKCLSQSLHVLASDPALLKNLYKRYAFLRCEDEREQALHYLQTLNTVDFSCFTNAYNNASVLYQVLIFPSGKCGHVPCTANLWLHVVGSHRETAIISVPRGVLLFSFWAKNVGVITSLRMGHDNVGPNPSWLVDHVLIKNEFTGHTFKFACGRWLGQGIDDSSTERYMVGYPVNMDADEMAENVLKKCALPPPQTFPWSPSTRRSDNAEEIVELQTMLGDAINRLVKFYHKNLNEKISYAHLMCGESGLVAALLNIFSFGFKSARLFGRNLFVWDFFLKVTMDFNQSLAHLQPPPASSGPMGSSSGLSAAGSAVNSPLNSPKRFLSNTLDSPRRNASLSSLLDSPRKTTSPNSGTAAQVAPATATLSRANQFRRMYTKLITRIETTCVRLGKDDKFQLFVCLSAHDRLLGRIVTDFTRAIAAQQLYEDYSFLRTPNLTMFLSHILEALQDISVPVDPVLKATLENHQSV